MGPLSGVLSEAWALYRRHASHFIVISFAIYLVISVVNALLAWSLGGAGVIIGWVITFVGMYLLQAALVTAVQDVRDGRVDLDLRATVSAALPFVGAVTVASILASIGIAVGIFLLIVPGLILITYWSLIVPEIVIGRSGPFDAFSRSWRTVSGYGWNVFATFILVFLALLVGEIVLALILSVLPVAWRNLISDLVVGTLVTPYIAAVVTLVYYRLTAAHSGQGQPGQAEPGQGGYGQYSGDERA